jgi:hypothetical protein
VRRVSPWACALAAALGASACGNDESAAANDRDAASTGPETGTVAQRRIVVVNALTEVGGTFDALRFCLDKNGEPLPSSIVPLTNFAGIARGGGVDLGEPIGFAANLELELFDARQVAGAAQPKCLDLLEGTLTHAPITTAVPTSDANLVAFVTDANAPNRVGVRTFALGEESSFVPGRIAGVFVDLATGAATTSVDLAGASSVSSTPTAVSNAFSIPADPKAVLTVAHAKGTLSMSLQSIQYVSDPTSTPQAFFAPRRMFLFALVGDATEKLDPSTPAQNQTGREFRIVAIPYGSGG